MFLLRIERDTGATLDCFSRRVLWRVAWAWDVVEVEGWEWEERGEWWRGKDWGKDGGVAVDCDGVGCMVLDTETTKGKERF